MYDKNPPSFLRSGDVFKLDENFFKNHIKNHNAKNLLADYSKNNKYCQLWCVLNKTCDLSPKGQLGFKSNLILSPLIGLRTVLKENLIPDIVPLSKPLHSIFLEPFTDFLYQETKKEKSKSSLSKETFKSSYNKVFEGLKEDLKSLDVCSYDEELLFNTLKKSRNTSSEIFDNFKKSHEWKRKKDSIEEGNQKSQKLSISGEKVFTNLVKNQVDGLGYFYYEPSEILKTKNDISYVTFFEEIISIKLKNEARLSIIENLLNPQIRVASLSEGFSARFQNLFSSFYGKIGTEDVSAVEIRALYQKNYSEFFDYKNKN
jgi:hypothetical protein